MAEPKFADAIFAVVRRIPKGRVASYGLVARMAGYPRGARFVGGVMRLSPRSLPWHRVLAQDGRVVITNPALRMEQVMRLRAEGVVVSDEARVDYERYAWRPRSAPAQARRSSVTKS